MIHLSPTTVAAVFFMLAGCATEAAPVEVTSPSPVTTVVPPREIEPPAPALQAGPQTGGVYCELRDKLLKKLEEKFVERPIGMGVNTVGTLVEVRVSEDGRTWSIIGTRPNGWSCVVTSGKEWRLPSLLPLCRARSLEVGRHSSPGYWPRPGAQVRAPSRGSPAIACRAARPRHIGPERVKSPPDR